jgi:hypothetical protein
MDKENNRKKLLIVGALSLLLGIIFGAIVTWNHAQKSPIGQCSFKKNTGLYQLEAGYYTLPSGKNVWVYGGVAREDNQTVNLSVSVTCQIPKNVLKTTAQIPTGEVITDENGVSHVVYMAYMAQVPELVQENPLP